MTQSGPSRFAQECILDDFSRYIIAWKLCTTMKAGDVTDTLELALQASGRATISPEPFRKYKSGLPAPPRFCSPISGIVMPALRPATPGHGVSTVVAAVSAPISDLLWRRM